APFSLVPYFRFALRSKLRPTDVLLKLAEACDREFFDCRIRDHWFMLQRVINYRNIGLPVVEGKVIESTGDQGVLVDVKFRLRYTAQAALAIWLLMTIGLCVWLLVRSFRMHSFGFTELLVAFSLPFGGYLIFLGGFILELGKAVSFVKRALSEVSQANG